MQIDRPITIAVTLFVILLLIFFLVMPEYKTFGALQTELGEKTAEFNAEFDYYAAITKTYNDILGRQDDIKKVDDALPEDPELGRLIYFLQETAKGNGLIVKDLFLSKSSTSNTHATVSNEVKDLVFSIDLLGNYSSLGKFMVALESSSRIFEIMNISFGSSAAGGTSSPVSGSSPVQSTQSAKPIQTQFQTQQAQSFTLQIKTHSY